MFVYEAGSLAIVDSNAAALREFGYARFDFLAITLNKICPPAQVKAILESMDRSRNAFQEPELWRFCRKEGPPFQVRTTLQSVQFNGREAWLASLEECDVQKPEGCSVLNNVLHRQKPERNAVWLMDLDCRIMHCNKAACELFGKTKQEITGRQCQELVGCNAEPGPECPCRRMLLSHQHETKVLSFGTRWYRVSVDPQFGTTGELVGAIHTLRDITESKEMEAALQHSDRLFRQLANAMPQLVWIADSAAVVSYFNERVTEYSGAVAKADGTWDWQQLVHPHDLAATQAAWHAAANTARPYTMQHRLRMADGHYRWHLSRAIPVKNSALAVSQWFGTTTDIHDFEIASAAVRKSQQQLEQRVVKRTAQLASATDRLRKEMLERTALQKQLLSAGEHERERLGRDLHDGLCQLLAGIRCKTEQLKLDLTADFPAAGRRAGLLHDLLTQAMREVRGLARGLQPVASSPDGLMHGLLELAHSVREMFGIQCKYRVPQPVLLHDHRAATELYRLAQEAVSNAARHGKPTVIRIGLKRTGRRLELTIANNGKPFPNRVGGAGLGIKAMRARAEHIGAKLVIGPGKSSGTLVRCSMLSPEIKAGTRELRHK